MKKKTSIKNHEVVHVLKEEKGSYTLRPDGDAFTDTIVHGDAATTLAALPDSFVQCIVTSPPYYFQRDYGDHKQLQKNHLKDTLRASSRYSGRAAGFSEMMARCG